MSFPYLLALGPSSGTAPDQEVTFFDSWSLSKNFDDGCVLNFTMPGNSVPGILTTELDTDIWLYYNGQAVERMRVVQIENEWGADGSYRMSVQAVCYRRILAARYVVSNLVINASQGAIVWDLISHTQSQTNGNYGITVNSLGPTVLRERTYAPGQNILDAITDLTQIENGITWEIDAALELTVSQASLYPTAAQPVILGANALSIRKPSGAAQFGNVALVSGDSALTTLEILPTAGLAGDPRGRWERYRGYPVLVTQPAVLEAAQGLLEDINSPVIIFDFTLEPTRYLTDSHYELGDFITIVQPAVNVPNYSNPSLSTATVAAQQYRAQVITQSIEVDAAGKINVRMSAVRAPAP
jgi:hypothetical protein